MKVVAVFVYYDVDTRLTAEKRLKGRETVPTLCRPLSIQKIVYL